jgi:hypothetical protein
MRKRGRRTGQEQSGQQLGLCRFKIYQALKNFAF